jgi:hypothetical protein
MQARFNRTHRYAQDVRDFAILQAAKVCQKHDGSQRFWQLKQSLLDKLGPFLFFQSFEGFLPRALQGLK